MLRGIGKHSGESVESVLKKKKRLRWEGFAEKGGFKPGMDYMDSPDFTVTSEHVFFSF